MQRDPWIQVFTRLGAVIGVIFFLFGALTTALEYGRHLGIAFNAALADTPLGGELGATLMIAFASFLGGLAALMICILAGALLGSALGAVVVRYVMAPLRSGSETTPRSRGNEP
jgi:hypothetical protein